MLKSNTYWKRRMEMLEEAQMKKGEQYLKDIEDQYRKVTKNIESDLSVWYRRFANNNEISMVEARKLLNTKELAEFKWDVNEYIKYGKENAFNKKWMKQLENASTRVHISRLESLKIQLQQQIEVLYGNRTDQIDDLLQGIYKDGYYHTAFEIQKGFNIGWDLHTLNDNQLDKILSKPWTLDSKTFSNRLWTNKQLLINNLQTHLTQAVITGKAPDEVIKRLSALFETDRNKAGRLVMTESAAFASMAQKDCFKTLDVEKYEIVATLDNHTSAICQDLDGEVFDMNIFEIGVTAPPFHPWCRTTTVPHFDDEFSLGERVARDEEGNVYYVPSDMKYKDWKESFVDGGSKDGLIKLDDKLENYRSIYSSWNGKDKKVLADAFLKAEGLPVESKVKPINDHGYCMLPHPVGGNIKLIEYALNSEDKRSMSYQIKTLFHELFHAKSHGLPHPIGTDVTFKEWAYADDIFAEVTANYINKQVGILDEIAPSYPGYLVEALPKLKMLPEFKDCNSISDFGEIAYKFRFGDKPTAQWKNIVEHLNKTQYNIGKYSKPYIEYIKTNKEELVDKLLENMPKYAEYRSYMIDDVAEAIDDLENGITLSGNKKVVFERALITTMDRLGVMSCSM